MVSLIRNGKDSKNKNKKENIFVDTENLKTGREILEDYIIKLQDFSLKEFEGYVEIELEFDKEDVKKLKKNYCRLAIS
jgi:hypothetical protein